VLSAMLLMSSDDQVVAFLMDINLFRLETMDVALVVERAILSVAQDSKFTVQTLDLGRVEQSMLERRVEERSVVVRKQRHFE